MSKLKAGKRVYRKKTTDQNRKFDPNVEGYYVYLKRDKKKKAKRGTPLKYGIMFEGELYTVAEFYEKFTCPDNRPQQRNISDHYIHKNRPPMEFLVRYNAKYTPVYEPKECPYTFEDLKVYDLVCARKSSRKRKKKKRSALLRNIAYGRATVQKGKII